MEKSEPPGDWTVVMGKEKASLGTEQRLPSPLPPQVHQKHETSSNTDYQREGGGVKNKIKEITNHASQGLKQTLRGNPRVLPLSLPPSLPRDEKGQHDRTHRILRRKFWVWVSSGPGLSTWLNRD